MLDSRPEDALFAETRVLAAYDPVHYTGLGYGPGPIGTAIQSTFSSTEATPVAFAISGTDPITQDRLFRGGLPRMWAPIPKSFL